MECVLYSERMGDWEVCSVLISISRVLKCVFFVCVHVLAFDLEFVFCMHIEYFSHCYKTASFWGVTEIILELSICTNASF